MKVISLVLRDIRKNKLDFLGSVLVISLIVFLASLSVSLERGSASRISSYYKKAGGNSLIIEDKGKIPYLESVSEEFRYYSALNRNSTSDIYYLVRESGDTREYLGTRVNLLGVPEEFNLKSDYYVRSKNMKKTLIEGLPFFKGSNLSGMTEAQEWLNIKKNQKYIRIPLIPRKGDPNPRKNEAIIDQDIMNFLGAEIGEVIKIDLVQEGREYLGKFEVVGSFDTVGAEGEKRSFWRIFHGESFFDTRPPESRVPSVSPVIIDKKNLNKSGGTRIIRSNSLESRKFLQKKLESAGFDLYKPRTGGNIEVKENVSKVKKGIGILSLMIIALEVLSSVSLGFIWTYKRHDDLANYKKLGFDGFQINMLLFIPFSFIALISLISGLITSEITAALLTEINRNLIIFNVLLALLCMLIAGIYGKKT